MSVTISGDTGVDKFNGTTIAGHIIQVANYTTGAMATGTAVIPYDNTIPQITEGTQFMSLAFTPKKSNSLLKISIHVQITSTVSNDLVTALFRDSTVNSIGTSKITNAAANQMQTDTFIVFVPATSTSLTTFTVRCGGGSAGTTTFNGSAGTAYYGGSLASSITIEEIAQ